MVDMSKTRLPRETQSDLHDFADRFGERIARGELVDLSASTMNKGSAFEESDECTCKKYSKRITPKSVMFWEEPDPDCKFVHFTPQSSRSYTVPL